MRRIDAAVCADKLAQHAGRVFAVELDKQLADILKEDLSAFDNVAIINADILQITPAVLLEEQKQNKFRLGYIPCRRTRSERLSKDT